MGAAVLKLKNIAVSIIHFHCCLDASSGWWDKCSIGLSVRAALTSAAIMVRAAVGLDAPRASNCSGCHRRRRRRNLFAVTNIT